jgi:hypothetical protein
MDFSFWFSSCLMGISGQMNTQSDFNMFYFVASVIFLIRPNIVCNHYDIKSSRPHVMRHEIVQFQMLVRMPIVAVSQKPLHHSWPWRLASYVLKTNMFMSFCDILFICQILNIRGPLPILNCLPSWLSVHFRPVRNSGRSHAERKAKGKVRWVPCFQVLGIEIEHYGVKSTLCRYHDMNTWNFIWCGFYMSSINTVLQGHV